VPRYAIFRHFVWRWLVLNFLPRWSWDICEILNIDWCKEFNIRRRHVLLSRCFSFETNLKKISLYSVSRLCNPFTWICNCHEIIQYCCFSLWVDGCYQLCCKFVAKTLRLVKYDGRCPRARTCCRRLTFQQCSCKEIHTAIFYHYETSSLNTTAFANQLREERRIFETSGKSVTQIFLEKHGAFSIFGVSIKQTENCKNDFALCPSFPIGQYGQSI